VPTENHQTTRLEGLSESVSRSLAGRVSRRSFLGRLGKGAIAASLGASSAALLRTPSSAQAALICSGSSNNCSIACDYLKGWVVPYSDRGKDLWNYCPTGTCKCGSWVVKVIQTTCGSTYRRWTDCCDTQKSWCPAHGGCNCNSTGADGNHHPSCCNTKEWGSCANDDCGKQGQTKIVCRFHKCVPDLTGECYPSNGTYCQP
jgi:hypothetical protein